ncbi:IS5 family transposase [Streptomyces sp. NPDC127114]|uniref:IS5 family transposase n=1 Tax=Streptomyces sp. NPDC127114 TaxID=3345366 RepID=UPI00363281E7
MPLTDAPWARIEPLLPDRTPRRGGRWRDHREVIDAIAWNFQTGSQWVHLPETYGNWRGVYNRLRMWAIDGTWERVFTTLVAGRRRRRPQLDRLGRLDRRAGTPARGWGPQKGAPAGEPADHAIGRSRGGLTTKIHLASDAHCRPLVFVLTAGQAGDAPAFAHVYGSPARSPAPRTAPHQAGRGPGR